MDRTIEIDEQLPDGISGLTLLELSLQCVHYRLLTMTTDITRVIFMPA